MSTSVHKALPGKLDIKRHSPSILYKSSLSVFRNFWNPFFEYLFICFCYFTSQVNSYGHGGTVSSLYHTFFTASMNKQLTSTSCTYFRLLLTTTVLERFSGREENELRNYLMIDLHESMVPGRDQTREPWTFFNKKKCSFRW